MPIFSSVKFKKPRRSTFDLSHERLLTTRIGRLTPILCQEVIPGDTFRLNTALFARLLPLQTPAMAQFDIYTHFFFVPNRLLWDKWEDFITGGKDGLAKPVFPTTSYSAIAGNGASMVQAGSNLDYLGFPSYDGTNIAGLSDANHISQLPFRALGCIWNEYYRDESIDPEIDFGFNLSGHLSKIGANLLPLFQPMYRRWKKDYFTSALPWPQRGADVLLPYEADIVFNPNGKTYVHDSSYTDQGASRALYSNAENGDNFPADVNGQLTSSPSDSGIIGVKNPITIDNSRNLELESRSATVNELRRSLKVQEWLEKNARGGYRYIEQILSHFGVRSSDSRLQRPEYLGGGKTPINISEIPQTSEGTAESPQGTLVGKGTSIGFNHSFKRFFEEHGIIIGLMSIVPKSLYMQGMPRFFTKFDKFDFAWPEFGNLGEQEIRQDEIYYNPSAHTDENEALFGYTPRYAEYKYAPSTVHGQFRTSLTQWHSARIFTNNPRLNADFLAVRPEQFGRLFAVDDEDNILVQLRHNIKSKRTLPYYGTPRI